MAELMTRAEIEALKATATPAPWELNDDDDIMAGDEHVCGNFVYKGDQCMVLAAHRLADTALALLDEVERLRAQTAEQEAAPAPPASFVDGIRVILSEHLPPGDAVLVCGQDAFARIKAKFPREVLRG